MSELDELERQIAELQAKMKVIIDTKRNEVLKEMLSNVRQYSFTAQELGLSSQPTKKATKVKKVLTFHDPATGNEWDGDLDQKGRKPDWIKKKIADGTIEQFRLKQ